MSSKAHGGRRPGAGRPRQPTIRDVALQLSRPSEKPSIGTAKTSPRNEYVSAEYRPSKASARRSSIPAAAVRARGPEDTIEYRKRSQIPPREADERDWLFKKGCRSLFSIEAQFSDILDAQAANDKTTSNRKRLLLPVPDNNLGPDNRGALPTDVARQGRSSDTGEAFRTLAECGLDSIMHGSPSRRVPGHEPGASIGDFLMEDFYGGGKMPVELRGIKRVAR